LRVSVRVRLGRNPSSFRPTKSSTEEDDDEEEVEVEEEEENRALIAVTSALFMATLLPPTSMYVDTCSTQRSAARAIKHHNTNVRRTLRYCMHPNLAAVHVQHGTGARVVVPAPWSIIVGIGGWKLG
jgi:hypothetical protein